MLSDEVTVVVESAKGMEPACALEVAGQSRTVTPQGTAGRREGRRREGMWKTRACPCGFRRALACSALAAALASLLPLYGAAAQEVATVDEAHNFDLPAGGLDAALEAFGMQSGIQPDYPPALVAGRQVRAVSGRMGWRDALGQLLQGSGLEYRQVGDMTVVIRSAAGRAGTEDGSAAPRRTVLPSQTASAVTDLESMTVTGTRVRGGVTPSPVIEISAQRIREEGFADLGEVVRSVPQNFGGGQNPGVASGANLGGSANQNFSGGSALNLRGLGPDATLTLLNGRRLAYGGLEQAVDISAIPVEAVERIEVMVDGASAIYGSDAVGGVANVLLKRDFEGLNLRARYGRSDDGGLSTKEYSATAGTTWADGGVLATWMDVSSDPIFVDQRRYTDHLPDPNTIYPGIESKSALVTAHHRFGEGVGLRFDGLRTRRSQTQYIDYGSFYYYAEPETSIYFISPSVEFQLPGDWMLSIGATYGKDEYEYRTYAVTADVSTLWSNGCYCNWSRSYEAGAEGPLFTLGGSDVRVAVGAGVRTAGYLTQSYTASEAGNRGTTDVRYGYAEINLPLAPPAPSRPGIKRLDLSAAVRFEDHDSFGGVTTPKIGFVYGPTEDLTFKASWGRSFKAPTLYQRYSESSAVLLPAGLVGGTGYPPEASALMAFGSNPELGPERARTWSASLGFHPEAIRGFEAGLTWFNIEYTGRVMQPLQSYLQALSNPNYAPFIDYEPTVDKQADLISAFEVFQNFTGVPYDPDTVVALIHNQYTNVARQRVRGLDLMASHYFDLGEGRLSVRGAATWLDSEQQNNPGQEPYDLAGIIFRPAKYRARAGAVWNLRGLSAAAFLNYTSGVTNNLAGGNDKGASFTTTDMTLRYEMGYGGGSASGLAFDLSVQNVFNRAPPLYVPTSPAHVPYDSTNYSAIGRFVGIAVSKQW